MTIIPERLALRKPKKELLKKTDVSIKEKILFKKETNFHSIYVVENNFGRFIKYLDTYQAGYIKTKEYQGNLPYINYFLIPYLMNKNIKDILFIGFGSGIVINQYEKIFEKLKRIDIVDIEEYIFPLAEKYFNFKRSDKMNFYLQDAIIYLKTTKKKYDLIVADVAGNVGIDERFVSEEYLGLINIHLKTNGIFVSNMPSSSDILNKKNKFVQNLIKKYNNYFKNINLYNGKTSNRIYYKTFFNTDEDIFGITNLILISSNKEYKISKDFENIKKLNIDILSFIEDLINH